MIVVSDSSPLNVLVRISHVEVLCELFGRVIIPPAVAAELSHERTPGEVRAWITAYPSWLVIQTPTKLDPTLAIADLGELEAISLALELKANLLLVDDRKARRLAMQRGLAVTGVIGVLELAAARGLLKLQDAFERIRTTDFKIADKILCEALERDARQAAGSSQRGLPPSAE